jgi:phosphopantothenoylcysteine decarboxylase/phosphopantothenate--cysteine ligase
MGFALARACIEAGAEVSLVSGPVTLPTPRGVARINVTSALEMREAVKSALAGRHLFIGVAAVADYRPKLSAEHKIKKGSASLTLELEATPDILAEVAALPNAPFCVGFAAESRDLATYAEGKRVAKNLRLVVGNLVQDGLGGDDNQVTLFDANGVILPGQIMTIARGIVAPCHVDGVVEMHRIVLYHDPA